VRGGGRFTGPTKEKKGKEVPRKKREEKKKGGHEVTIKKNWLSFIHRGPKTDKPEWRIRKRAQDMGRRNKYELGGDKNGRGGEGQKDTWEEVGINKAKVIYLTRGGVKMSL